MPVLDERLFKSPAVALQQAKSAVMYEYFEHHYNIIRRSAGFAFTFFTIYLFKQRSE